MAVAVAMLAREIVFLLKMSSSSRMHNAAFYGTPADRPSEQLPRSIPVRPAASCCWKQNLGFGVLSAAYQASSILTKPFLGSQNRIENLQQNVEHRRTLVTLFVGA